MNWLEVISWVSIAISIIQTIIITVDIVQYPQKMMPIMNIVWPLTGLYFPIIGIWAYYILGRAKEQMDMKMDHLNMEFGMDMNIKHGKHSGHLDHSHHMEHHHGNMQQHSDMHHPSNMHHHAHGEKPFWQSVFVSTTHCSSGCSLGDIIGAPLVSLTGLTIGGMMLYADYVVEFMLAFLFGIAFQYYGMGFQKHEQPGQALKDALKADTLSLIAFEIGMFGWMALTHYVFFNGMLELNNPVFWFMMQIAMMLGFVTSYPANWVLVKKGIKHAM